MTATERLFVVVELEKLATAASLGAGAAGMLGPIGNYAYGKLVNPDEGEQARYAMMGRGALGGSLGSLAGTAVGIPIAMATGIPLLPGMLLSTGLGMVGGGLGSYMGARRYWNKRKKKQQRKKSD